MKQWLCLIFSCLISLSAFAQSPQPLPVDKAFQLTVSKIDHDMVQLHWDIADGYHLYRDNFKFELKSTKDGQVGQVNLPQGIPTHDAILGDYQIYKHGVDIDVPFTVLHNRQPELIVGFQGCSDSNFCYPPVTKNITLDFDHPDRVVMKNHETSVVSYTLQDKVAQLLKQRNYFWILLAFIGFGLLLAFTPCVLPMIPILSGIIVGQNREDLNMRRAFFLSLTYVMGMSLTYAGAGVLVALAGSHLTQAFQAPWVIILFSVLFIVLAFSLFGFYELRLPHFLQHPVVHLSNKQRSGSFIGAFIMGALSVLIVSPCVTAPLVGVLTFIAQSGDVILGSVALFALGIGMGIPLVIIGTTEGRFMPKSGAWMEVIKSAFGVLLIAVAIYLLQRILPGSISLLLWAALLIILAVYLGVGSHHRTVSSGWLKFGKGLGLLSFCYGVILLVGAALGNCDPLKPLKINGLVTATSVSNEKAFSEALVFRPVKTFADVQDVLNYARQRNQPVMLDFYADWCVSCHEMDRTTFSDPDVKAALRNVILIRADVTANDKSDSILENYFGVIAPPTVLFFDAQGKELKDFRVVGGLPPKTFLAQIQTMRSQGIRF